MKSLSAFRYGSILTDKVWQGKVPVSSSLQIYSKVLTFLKSESLKSQQSWTILHSLERDVSKGLKWIKVLLVGKMLILFSDGLHKAHIVSLCPRQFA